MTSKEVRKKSDGLNPKKTAVDQTIKKERTAKKMKNLKAQKRRHKKTAAKVDGNQSRPSETKTKCDWSVSSCLESQNFYMFLLQNFTAADLIRGSNGKWTEKLAAVGQAAQGLLGTDLMDYGLYEQNLQELCERAFEEVVLIDADCTLEQLQWNCQRMCKLWLQDGEDRIPSNDEDDSGMEQIFL